MLHPGAYLTAAPAEASSRAMAFSQTLIWEAPWKNPSNASNVHRAT